MGVQLDCLIEILEKNGHDPIYVDVHGIGSVAYHFKECVLTFKDGCVPNDITAVYLGIFDLSIESLVKKEKEEECSCDW